jgi:hypothetical protein
MADHGAAGVETTPAFVAAMTLVPNGAVVTSSISERRDVVLLTLTRKAGPFAPARPPAQRKTTRQRARGRMNFDLTDNIKLFSSSYQIKIPCKKLPDELNPGGICYSFVTN